MSSPPEDSLARSVPEAIRGRFEVREELGTGAFGRVLLATDRSLRRRVAIKLLTSLSPGVLERFRREARVTGLLRHPHIAEVYDYGEADGVPFIVYEFLEGRSLRDLLGEGIRFDRDRVRRWAIQLASAMVTVHEAGILHRDLKPDNVMIRKRDYGAVLVDFGLASSEDPGESLTRTGAVLGTVRYMAPESMFRGSMEAASDQYALAATLVTTLAGKVYERPYLHLQGKPDEDPFPVDPEDWMGALARALAWDPGDRFPAMSAFLAALEEAPEEAPDWEALTFARAPSQGREARTEKMPRVPAAPRDPTRSEDSQPPPGASGPPSAGVGPNRSGGRSGAHSAQSSQVRPEPRRRIGVLLVPWAGLLMALAAWWSWRTPELPVASPPAEAVAGEARPETPEEVLARTREALERSARKLRDAPLPEAPLEFTPGRAEVWGFLDRLLEPRAPLHFGRFLEALEHWLVARLRVPLPARGDPLELEALRQGVVFCAEVRAMDRLADSTIEWGPLEASLAQRALLVNNARQRFRECSDLGEDFLRRLPRGALERDLESVLSICLVTRRLELEGFGEWVLRLLRLRREGPLEDPARELRLRDLELTVVTRDATQRVFPCEARIAWMEHYLETPWVSTWPDERPEPFLTLSQRGLANCPPDRVLPSLRLADRAWEQVPDLQGEEAVESVRGKLRGLHRELRALSRVWEQLGPRETLLATYLRNQIEAWRKAHPEEQSEGDEARPETGAERRGAERVGDGAEERETRAAGEASRSGGRDPGPGP